MTPIVVDTIPVSVEMPAIPGREATHTFRGITLGDETTWPHYRLREVAGLRSKPDNTAPSDPALGRPGEIARRGRLSGKTVTYRGDVRGQTLAQLRLAEGALAGAFADMVEDDMVIVPQVSPLDEPGGSEVALPTVKYTARVIGCEVSDAPASPGRDDRGYVSPFVIGLRMSDPRFFALTPLGPYATSTVAPQTGIAPPMTPPVTVPAPGSASSSVMIDSPGTAPADPIVDIYGPVTNPRIVNESLPGAPDLTFADLDVADGFYIRVDFHRRTIQSQDGASLRGYLDMERSEWWDDSVPGLQAGSNTIGLYGDQVADPARAVVTFSRADW